MDALHSFSMLHSIFFIMYTTDIKKYILFAFVSIIIIVVEQMCCSFRLCRKIKSIVRWLFGGCEKPCYILLLSSDWVFFFFFARSLVPIFFLTRAKASYQTCENKCMKWKLSQFLVRQIFFLHSSSLWVFC